MARRLKSGMPNWRTAARLKVKRWFLPTRKKTRLLKKIFIEDKSAAFLAVMPEMLPFTKRIADYLSASGHQILLQKPTKLSRVDIEEIYGIQARTKPNFLRAPIIKNWPSVVLVFKANGRNCFTLEFKEHLRKKLVSPVYGKIPEPPALLEPSLRAFIRSIPKNLREAVLTGIHMPRDAAEIIKDSNVFLTNRELKMLYSRLPK